MPQSVRHHAGIKQTGVHAGNLKQGYKYVHSSKVDKQVKKGCMRPIVKKAKKTKK